MNSLSIDHVFCFWCELFVGNLVSLEKKKKTSYTTMTQLKTWLTFFYITSE